MSTVFNDQDNEFGKIRLTNLDNITVNRKPTTDNELSNKQYVHDLIGEGSIIRINQSLQNYLQVSVLSNFNSLTKYDRIQITDTTLIKYPKQGGFLLQQWIIKCNGKIQNFIKSSKTNKSVPNTDSTTLPPIEDSFMFVQTR